jgi:LEA14-like dessication related protein
MASLISAKGFSSPIKIRIPNKSKIPVRKVHLDFAMRGIAIVRKAKTRSHVVEIVESRDNVLLIKYPRRLSGDDREEA